MRILFFLALAIFLGGTQAIADTDEGLYAPKAPEGSAFVRFVNVGDVSLMARVNNKDLGSVDTLATSSYYVFSEGDIKFSIGGAEGETVVSSEKYYTVLNSADVIQDTANADRTKATLAFYNLTGSDVLTVKAKSGTVSVLENVGAGSSAARDINPVKIDLSIHAEGQDAVAVEPFIMERGNHYSVFYNGKEFFVVTAAVDTTR